jgi:hypothetical protein
MSPSLPIAEDWQRRPREPARAYEAARAYFEMRAARSLTSVAQKYAKSTPLIKRWSVKWQWVSRAAAFDRYMDEVAERAVEKATREAAIRWQRLHEELRERKYQASVRLLDRVDKMLDFPLATVTTTEREGLNGTVIKTTIIKPARWSMDSAGRLAVLGFRLAAEAIRGDGGLGNDEPAVRAEEFAFSDFT